uniref:Uncharacterized protein n=1 Tax=Populus alba TaxID=43335 RepID=A0A4U5NP00_POPAL|nr:hypothetical protein D5086_0000248480 [Populus alba]
MLEGYNGNNTLLCDNVIEEQPVQENYEENTELEIMLHALTRWTVPKTMQIVAIIGSHNVIVLINNGSTHNFISKRLANGLLVVPTKAFTMQIANSENLKCLMRLKEVRVDLQDTHSFLFCSSYRVGSSLGNLMARNAGFCGLQLEAINHGISLKEPDQVIAKD